MLTKESTQDIARQITELEGSFCNSHKLREAEELRQDLRRTGLTDREIDRLAGED